MIADSLAKESRFLRFHSEVQQAGIEELNATHLRAVIRGKGASHLAPKAGKGEKQVRRIR
jgi:hypothetical protein